MNLDLEIPDFELPEIEVDQEKIQEPIEETPVIENVEGQEKPEGSESTPAQDEVAVAFYEQLKQRGYTFSDEFGGTWEEIDEYFDNLPQAVLQSVVQTMPDISKDVMSFIATAGQNLTKEEMKNFFNTYFEEQDSANVTLESNDVAREYLENHYKELGMKPKAIQSALDTLEEDEELIEEAKAIFEKKKETSQTKTLIEQKKVQNEQLQEEQRKFVSNVQKELVDTGWRKDRIEKVSKILSGDNVSQRLKQVFSNPKGLVQLADLLDYVTDSGEFNLDAFKRQAESNPTKKLQETLKKSQFSSGGSGGGMPTGNSSDDDLIPIFD